MKCQCQGGCYKLALDWPELWSACIRIAAEKQTSPEWILYQNGGRKLCEECLSLSVWRLAAN